LEQLNLILIPVIAGLIGWGTNYLAVKMIFHPYQPVRVLFFTFWGVIPRRQKELAASIAQTIEENLISHKDFSAVLASSDIEEEIEQFVRTQIDLFLRAKISDQPVIGPLVHGALAPTLEKLLINEFRDLIPLFLDDLMQKVESRVNFREIIRRKIESFELEKLERMVYEIASRELKAIEIWGGVLGFIVGLLQVTAMVVFG
jgi:uncharacterized membrane protein YheB (UPF0754 family)